MIQRFSLCTMLLALISAACLTTSAVADAPPNQTIHLTDGAIGLSYNHCGDNDLCAKITYPSGNSLAIYSEGAALCQPYYLHFVESDTTGKTLYEFSKPVNHTTPKGMSCGHTVATEMVLDRGDVHLSVTENPDGTLNLTFSAIPK